MGRPRTKPPMTKLNTPKTLRLISIGNSLGVILPVDVLDDLGIKRKVGESLVLQRCSASQRLELSAENRDFQKKLAALREVVEHYDDALRELAK